MPRPRSPYEAPLPIVVELAEIDAPIKTRVSRGYWSAAIERLCRLLPTEGLRFDFPAGIPGSAASSIRTAARRRGVQVSIRFRGARLYLYAVPPEPSNEKPLRGQACMVCGTVIVPKSGTGRQLVCSAGRKIPTECQKVLRLARERHITVEEARRRRLERTGVQIASRARRLA